MSGVSPSSFLNDFPEFSNATIYPVSAIQFWINSANTLLNPCRFADILDQATELFVAHFLTLMQRNALAATVGGIPGQQTGALASKSADKVSAGYDVNVAAIKDGTHWNLSTYGIQFLFLSRMAGMGGYQAIGCGFVAPPFSMWNGGTES